MTQSGGGTVHHWTSCVLLAALLVSCGAQDVVEVGLLLPLRGTSCEVGAQFRRAAFAAKAYVESQSWWSVTGMELDLNVMGSNTSFQSWTDAESFAGVPCATGSTCLRAAMVGPYTSDATAHVEFVARAKETAVLSFGATSPLLSGQAYFLRLCPSDDEGAQSLFNAIKKFGWDQIAVVHVNNEYARAYEVELQQLVQADDDVSVSITTRFESGDRQQLSDALEAVKDSLTRVVVALMYDQDVELLYSIAEEKEMVGKGWTWIGPEWVADSTFAYAEDPATLRRVANGVVGTLPSMGDLTYNNSELATFSPSAEEIAACGALASGPDPAPAATYVAYVFDCVLSVAATVAELRGCSAPNSCSTSLSSITSKQVYTGLFTASIPDSPLTGPIEFASSGERLLRDTRFDMVNLQDDGTKLVVVAQRTGSSMWEKITAIIWPGGTTEVPSDRSLPEIGVLAAFFSIALLAVVVCVCIGYTIQRRECLKWFPSSGVVVLVGIVIGVIVQASDSAVAAEFEVAIKFDAQFFSLVFLPIIIFQSGYALKKHPFFSQLGSILTFATLGTLISTLLTGGVLYLLGQADVVARMSGEEALSFGALIAAVDPVSTLAQFGSLKVPLSLGALVYGESVINDAVSIVLYRTFTSFLTTEVSSGALVWAGISVLGMLIGSAIIGFIVAILSGFTVRVLQLKDTPHPSVAETGLLLVFSYAAFTITEAAHLSGIVASLACGICMNHYVKKILSPEGRNLAGATFMVMADIAETVVFLQVGLNVPLFAHVFSFPLVASTLGLCLVGRMLNVFPLAFLLNLGRHDRIPGSHQCIMWLSGLRGAIAYALAVQFPSHLVQEVTNTTAIIVVFTILVLGGSTRPALRLLKVEQVMRRSTHKEEVAMTRRAQAKSRCKTCLARFDARVLRRIVQGTQPGQPPTSVTDSPLHQRLPDTTSDGGSPSMQGARGGGSAQSPPRRGAAGVSQTDVEVEMRPSASSSQRV